MNCLALEDFLGRNVNKMAISLESKLKIHLAWDIWQFWTTSEAGRENQVFHLENSSLFSTSVDFDGPSFQVIVPLCLGVDGRSPYIELKIVGVTLQPIGELIQ